MSTVTFVYVPAFTPVVASDNVRFADRFPPPVRPVPALIVMVLSAFSARSSARLSLSVRPSRNASSSFHLLIMLSASLPSRKSFSLLPNCVTVLFSVPKSCCLANVSPNTAVMVFPSELSVMSVTAFPLPDWVMFFIPPPSFAIFQISFIVYALNVLSRSESEKVVPRLEKPYTFFTSPSPPLPPLPPGDTPKAEIHPLV